MHATYEGPFALTGQHLRIHLAAALVRVAYGLFYLTVAALLIGLPMGALFLIGGWFWLR